MNLPKKKHLLIGGGGFFLIYMAALTLPVLFQNTYTATKSLASDKATTSQAFVVTHINTPEPLKAIYMTACVAGTKTWREQLKKLVEDTELNSVVIDIKDATGRVSFPNDFPFTGASGCTVNDMQQYIASLHDKGIYVIGRVAVFQDPSYTEIHPELAVKSKATGGVWKDYKGLSFIDVGAKDYWDYIVAITKEAHDIGFDEINYDYVRYPSDGNLKDAYFSWTTASSTKADMLENFFSYLREHVEPMGVKMSVDVFGMTTTVATDMNIGQVLERALPYFDYVSPMVYPSHYPAHWNGFDNPAEYPYEVIQAAMSSAVAREQALRVTQGISTSTPSKFRPWLQDFNLGATYDASKVRAQIKATYDTGLDSWLLWNAGNKYTESALQPG